MALLVINGVTMPNPSTMIPSEMDIGKWERNARGNMIGEIIATKAKIELAWNYLTPAQLSLLLTTIKPTFVNVTYTDPVTNSARTAKFYKGDRNAPIMDFIDGALRYKDVKFNLIEQ